MRHTKSEPGAVATGSGREGSTSQSSEQLVHEENVSMDPSIGATRSLPPPHTGCPDGDPGPLPVLTLTSHAVTYLQP
jgi:hypothetical protein